MPVDFEAYHGAYTSVPARRTFVTSQPPPPEPPPPLLHHDGLTDPNPQPQVWPPSVRAYVSRAFQDQYQVPEVSSEDVTKKLREVINEKATQVGIMGCDWDNLPLPQHFILQERAHDRLQHAPQPPVTNNFEPAKKRKSMELEDSSIPHQTSRNTLFEDRVSYPSPQSQANSKQKKQKFFHDDAQAFRAQSDANGNLAKRRARFGDKALADISHKPVPKGDVMPQGTVIGTNTTLEKRYFRLTAPPKPETVRPLPVLRKTLVLLKDKWKAEHNYGYICDQFKSLRQDLTVQHIKNDFAVEVYEVHARIALDRGDLGEYNQCQTQLHRLYEKKLGGNPGEFLAYRILYCIYTANRPEMNAILANLTSEDRAHAAVQHALKTRSAVGLGNYHRFFRLYATAPNMGANLIETFLERERIAAMATISRAFGPTKGTLPVPLSFIAQELAFEEDSECAEFLCGHGGADFIGKKNDIVVLFAGPDSFSCFEQAKQKAFKGVDIKGQI